MATLGTYSDPEAYQAAVGPARVELLVTQRGEFRAKLRQVDLPRLWLRRCRESLSRVVHSKVSMERPPFVFLANALQPSMHHSGMEVSFGEIVAVGAGKTHHLRTSGASEWANVMVTQGDLAVTGLALTGRELALPTITHRVRPDPAPMERLLHLHEAVCKLAEAADPCLDQPEPVRALEQALLHTLITCISGNLPGRADAGAYRHALIVARLEDLLAANQDRPMYLAEICTAIGVAERTLRVCCQEHLGMGPVRFLWLRRMHLARRALIRASGLSGAEVIATVAAPCARAPRTTSTTDVERPESLIATSRSSASTTVATIAWRLWSR